MGNKTIGVDPNRVFGLQKDYSEKAHIAMKNNGEQFFDAFEAFLKANYLQKEELIEKVLGKKSGGQRFVVGEFFQHKDRSFINQYFGDNFRSLLWVPAQEKVLSISDFGKNNLGKYVLSKNMKDTEIQNNANSTPMTEDQFWAMFYLLIINPKLGKQIFGYELRKDKVYLSHVKFTSIGMVFTVYFRWNADYWFFGAYIFDHYNFWHEGNVFLFPVKIGN